MIFINALSKLNRQINIKEMLKKFKPNYNSKWVDFQFIHTY